MLPVDSERIYLIKSRINPPTLSLPRDAGEGNRKALKLFECRIYKGGADFPAPPSEEAKIKRQAVGRWIRTSGAFDAVVDFEKAMRDPAQPDRLLPAYDSGDHLRPNDVGYKAMAAALDLSLFSRDK